MADQKLTNIQVYKKKLHFNIGMILFILIFIYLVVTILTYLTGKHVSAYEVREGTIVKDNAYTGFVVRQEEVVPADADGYVNYFAPEGTKVGTKTNVYTLSPKELNFDTPSEETAVLTSEEQASLLLKSQSFSENFNNSHFSDIYTFRTSISSVLESKSSQSRQTQLDAMVSAGEEGLQLYRSARDGIVLYCVDGYEDIALGDVTEDIISKKKYERTSFANNDSIQAGEPVYKLVTSDVWTLVILLDDDLAQAMRDKKSQQVRFTKDAEPVWADFAIYNTKDANLGFLTFQNSMVRYLQDRYLDIELILEDQSGLKIPMSAVVKQDFYTVPEDYLTQGGNSKETGVLLDTGKDNPEFQKATIYYRDSKKAMVYLSTETFKENTVLIKPDSEEKQTLKEKKSLKGVYNINKGYAIFKPIAVLSESDEYYIVESGNDYGLSNYDHIALDGTSVQENDVVF